MPQNILVTEEKREYLHYVGEMKTIDRLVTNSYLSPNKFWLHQNYKIMGKKNLLDSELWIRVSELVGNTLFKELFYLS